MAEQLFHVKGLDQIQAFFDTLPAKVERNTARGSLRAAANEVKPAVVENIESVSGELAGSLKVSTRARGGQVTATIYTKVFYARFVEGGTKPHEIRARDGGALAFGGIFHSSVQHPGAKARPFMRPALDSKWQAAVNAAAEYSKRRLATKHGLDTADIVIGGEDDE